METTSSRFVELRGAYNFRDLGDLPTADRGRTRRGVMFRSDALHHLEAEDVEQLLALGIATVIDLRSTAEVEHTGRGPLGDESIGWVHAPLSNLGGNGYTPPPSLASGDLGAFYVETLAERTPQLVQVIELLASTEHLPAVFHCTAGKDRTGTVAALVLSIVGVDREAIIEDYALTDERMPRIIERLRAPENRLPSVDPAEAERRAQALAAGVARAEAASMRTFLDALDREHGGAAHWASDTGITDDTVMRLRELLVER
jgi:protein tyrosine/serine phosphatase